MESRAGVRLRAFKHGDTGGRGGAAAAAGGKGRGMETGADVPQHAALRAAPQHHRRRNRAVAALHVPAAQGPHRRNPEQHLACGDAHGLPERRNRAGVEAGG